MLRRPHLAQCISCCFARPLQLRQQLLLLSSLLIPGLLRSLAPLPLGRFALLALPLPRILSLEVCRQQQAEPRGTASQQLAAFGCDCDNAEAGARVVVLCNEEQSAVCSSTQTYSAEDAVS
jgi:hypothetical protein